ncbi:MAG: AmmeMemoRadiSam system protein B [Candidatus Omnitrophica bacterium]|nr:AmmeMemoRadiSam system protein B [Candidatus Omnitrophota bacterium]
MKRIALILLLMLFSAPISFAQTKEADLAGKWYDSSGDRLEAELDLYIKDARLPAVDGKIIAMLSPHAGYAYSGPVAAYGFKAIKDENIKTAVIVGFSHKKDYDGIAVLDYQGVRTPLGKIGINRKITTGLIARNKKIYDYPEAFSGENSVELILPFLQAVLDNFEVVLIAIGEQSYQNCRILGEALYEALKESDNFILIASTDMSHYLTYKEANEADSRTIDLIKKFNPDELYIESEKKRHGLMCGQGAVCATMIAAKRLGANKVEIFKYANSGDTSGDKTKVVGYLSAAFVNSNIKKQISNMGEEGMLTKEEKEKLLKLARESITYYLRHGKPPFTEENDPVLCKEMGAFVTLHKSGRLRGCIGNMVGKGPLYLTVRDMAIEAAIGDPRFPAVSLEEMKDIDIEISVLSRLEKITDPEKIEMGKHGVIVRKGFVSGVYLPQVATEAGWTREEFMDSLCGQKAGMNPDAWRTGECDIYIFTAEVFGEK